MPPLTLNSDLFFEEIFMHAPLIRFYLATMHLEINFQI